MATQTPPRRELPPEIAKEVEAFQRLDADVRNFITRHQQFEAQLNENQMVKEELDALKGADSVYKMHGKVLIRQDLAEAKSTVNSRIKLIQTEIAKVDRSIKEAQEKQQGLQRKIMELQQKRQAAGQA